jgi:glycosyltransferase involved in cell wall biosynthesis
LKKVTYILSHIDKAIAFEWIIDNIDSSKFQLSFILLNENGSAIEDYIRSKNIAVYRIPFSSKKDYPSAFLSTRKTIKLINPDIVHCHMRDANIIGLLAAKFSRIKKRIYTRHFSTYNHIYFPKAVKVDKLINRWSTDIVAISQVVKDTLTMKEGVQESKISLINHGFDLDKFANKNIPDIQRLKEEYNPDNRQPVVGVIARYIDWKGHKYIINAFQKLLEKYPDALFIFANCRGPEKVEISELIKKHIPKNSIEIDFEQDLFSLYHLLDIYVHTPINPDIEAFGQTYVEALAAGIPSVFSISGIAGEFIENNKNAIVVKHKNSEEIISAILYFLNNEKDRDRIILEGQKSVQRFGLEPFINKLESLYE